MGKKLDKKSDDKIQKENKETKSNKEKKEIVKKEVKENKNTQKKPDIDILEETINERKKLPKELKDKISNLIFFNIVLVMFMMIISLTINIMFTRFSLARFESTIKIIQITVCLISIVIFEISYKKDSFKYALYGIEFTLFSIAVLYVPYMFTLNHIDFLEKVIIAFVIYYIVKSIYIVIHYRNKYLKENISDVKEIVKEDKKGYLDEESQKTLKERKKKK